MTRIRSLGFDTVLLAPPFRPAADGNPFAAASFDRVHSLLASAAGDRTEDFVLPLAKAAAGHELELYIDLAFDRMAPGNDLVAERPDWFVRRPTDAAPDPRMAPESRHSVRPDITNLEGLAGLAERYGAVARGLVAMGVAGFRVLAPQSLPPELWRTVIARTKQDGRDPVFCAWTPGCSSTEVAALAGAGFTFSFASTPWWDLRSPWLVDEYETRRLSIPSIGLVEDPGGPRLAAALAAFEPKARHRILRQRLEAAAYSGVGYMMPQGFEHGAFRPLNPGGDQPGEWDWLVGEAEIDLAPDIRAVNRLLEADAVLLGTGQMQPATGADGAVTAIVRAGSGDLRTADRVTLVVLNPDERREARFDGSLATAMLDGRFALSAVSAPQAEAMPGPGTGPRLAPSETALYAGAAFRSPPPMGKPRSASHAAASPRIVIERVAPALDETRFAVKRPVGSVFTVEGDIYMDGHESLRAALLWRRPGQRDWQETEMVSLGNDRWRAAFPLTELGRHHYTILAWRDEFGTWRDEVTKKRAAGLVLAAELAEGVQLLTRMAGRAEGADKKALTEWAGRAKAATPDDGIAVMLDPALHTLMRRLDHRPDLVRDVPERVVYADRRAASFASWYELFPRSQSGDPARHGTFDDVIGRLPAVKAMGFDVLYMTPIHPIGRTNRKGRNNALQAAPADPGSPYAIGAEEGGHDAVHPELGGIEGFRRLVHAAAQHGMEIALDFAIQCSPDHPWLKEHKEWFAWRPDGSLRYAENPPKKYEDIVNVDFFAPGAVPGLWQALRDVILFWAEEGVRTFRVDNPHTKPLPFWEWMIADVQRQFPDVIFLSEAFTRPAMMKRLAKIGFTQSYTYFTWRNTKAEIVAYLTELTATEMAEYYRPHFFVNTPDINPHFLQTGGRPAHLIRAALATTLSGLWGMYSGFELCEARALPGREEYLDSEKYEIRAWDWQRPGNIVAEIAQLNRIRRENAALQSHLGIGFLNAGSDQILCFRKTTPSRDNLVVVAINLDPHAVQEAMFEIPLWEFGLDDGASVDVHDLMRGSRFVWTGKNQQVRLDPSDLPFAIWRLTPRAAGGG